MNMNKVLLSSLALFSSVFATDVSLGATNGQSYEKKIDGLITKRCGGISSEVFKAENKTFEQSIAKTVDKNVSDTISSINDKLKKTTGKSFWASDLKWQSSIKALKELVVRARDIYSATDEERTSRYNEMADLYKNAILRNLASNKQNALGNAGSALTSWMVYLALYKRFHEECYGKEEYKRGFDKNTIKKLFRSVISQLRETLSTQTVSIGGQNVNAWELLREKHKGENNIINMLKNDWSCYLYQLNVISFDENFYRSTAEKVETYIDVLGGQIKKTANNIAQTWPKYKIYDYISYTKDGLLLTLKKSVDTIRNYTKNEAQFKNVFSKFQDLRVKKSLPTLTMDVYNIDYIYFVRQFVDLLSSVEKYEGISLDGVMSLWLDYAGCTKERVNNANLNRLIENSFCLNNGDFDNDVVSKSVDILKDLVNLKKKYNLKLKEYKAVDLATIIQKSNVDVEDFYKRINALEWNDPNGSVNSEDHLTIQALVEIFYNRKLTVEEKNLICDKYDRFKFEADTVDAFLPLINFLIDCVNFKIDFLKILPKLGVTYRRMQYDYYNKFCRLYKNEDAEGAAIGQRCRLQTLYKLCPEFFDELFSEDIVKNKVEFKQALDNEDCEEVYKTFLSKDIDLKSSRKSGFEFGRNFFPKEIFEPGSKIEKNKFITSNK